MLERARAAGVDRRGRRRDDGAQAAEALALAERARGRRTPASASIRTRPAARPADLDELRRLLGHERAVAVGETGLDYFRDYAPHEAQRTLFERAARARRASWASPS